MNGKGHRGHKEVRTPARVSKVIGTAHGHDIVLISSQTKVLCKGVCGHKLVSTIATVKEHEVKIGLCTTSEACKAAVREKVITEVGTKVAATKPPRKSDSVGCFSSMRAPQMLSQFA